MKHFLILLISGALATNAAAQNVAETSDLPSPPVPYDQPIKFHNLGLEDGLAQGSIYDIHQDSKGFMWFANQTGISRYDGHNFKNYAHIPFDSTSAQTSWVFGIDEDSSGALWLAATWGGLSRLDPATGTFTHFAHDPADSSSITEGWVRATLVDREGVVWVGTGGGLNRMDPSNPERFERFVHVPDDPESLSANLVRSLFEDTSGTIWIATNNGLNRMHPEDAGRFERFLVGPSDIQGPERQKTIIHRMHQTPDEILWVGTQNGLVRLDPTTDETERIMPPDSENWPTAVLSITDDPKDQGVLWLAMPGRGIVRFDRRSREFITFRHDPQDATSPASNAAVSAHTDRSGSVWIGTDTGYGLTQFNPNAISFASLKASNVDDFEAQAFWGLYADSKGNLWAAGVDGAQYQVERETGTVRTWSFDPANPEDPARPAGAPFTFVEHPNGDIWVATTRGLDRFDVETERFTHYRHDSEDATSLPGNVVRAVFLDSRGDIWVGASRGTQDPNLARLDLDTGDFTVYAHDPDDEGSFRDAFVLSIAEDHKGMLWFGTGAGLSAMDPNEPGRFRHLSHDPRDASTITNGMVVDIVERKREPGILWIGTSGGGLDRLDTSTGEFKHYTETTSGLPNNIVYRIIEDDDGQLWLSTNRGLSRFNPEEESFTNYGIEHGLRSLEFNQWSGTRAPDGRIFFGSVNGINSFYPDEVTINSLPPPVALTDLRLFNERVVVGPDSPLKATLDRIERIELTHEQAQNVGFDFVALHYKNPELNRYSYQLEGFDPDWIDAGAQRSATYTNLPPGDYTFRVRAANSDGVWNEAGAAVLVSVLPPWWRAGWAYVLYGLLIAGVLAGVGGVQRRRLRRKAEFEQAELRARAAESEKEAAEAESKALQAENEKKKNAELLSEIGKELTSTLDLDTIFDRVYEHVNDLVPAPVFGIGLYNENEQTLEYRLAIENGKRFAPYTRNTNDKNQFPVWCIEHRKPVFVNDVEAEYENYIESYRHLGGRLEDGEISRDPQSLIYLPLITKDRVLGVISIQNFEKNAYSEHDLNILSALATYTAIAVDNADAYRRLNDTLDHLQSAQEQLVQQEKLASLGQLTAGIAHEIKNPLNFVTNFSALNEELATELEEIMQTRSADFPPNLADDIADLITSLRVNSIHISKHGKRADSIVRSMMEHASGGQGERFLVDVNAFVDEYVNLAYHGRRAQSPGFDFNVERDFQERLGSAEMAPQELGRVLVNLLNNAFDAVADQKTSTNDVFSPTVVVRTRRSNGQVQITVEDNGPGMPESVRGRIFEPFFTTKPTGSGTGLGLSLSYDIVTQGHGGRLEVASELGKGSAFTIALPVSDVEEKNDAQKKDGPPNLNPVDGAGHSNT